MDITVIKTVNVIAKEKSNYRKIAIEEAKKRGFIILDAITENIFLFRKLFNSGKEYLQISFNRRASRYTKTVKITKKTKVIKNIKPMVRKASISYPAWWFGNIQIVTNPDKKVFIQNFK